MKVYLALFVDGDNGFENYEYCSVFENYEYGSVFESYMCADQAKIFENKDKAMKYLEDEIIRHYDNEDKAKEELNVMKSSIEKMGFYQDAEMDTYILIEKNME